MKRIFALLLSWSLALSLAACVARPRTQDVPAPAPDVKQETPPSPAPAAAQADDVPVDFLVVRAEYPAQVQYDAEDYEPWYVERMERQERYPVRPETLDGFLTAALPKLLAGGGENRVCSPLNIYLALAMAAEISGGESRAQLLSLLDADSLETLEDRADALWNANYRDDGTVVSILAGSLWMRDDDTPCLKGTVQTLRDVYHASSYRGDMGDARYTQALREWLNEQTGGQLQDAAENVTLDPQTMLELLTTVYFRARWLDRFDAANTSPAVFHAPRGDVECDFMNMEFADFWVYRAAHFTAVQHSLENAGEMWFLLPDEGVTPEDLLADPEAVAFLNSGNWEQCEWYYGKLALPKLDVTSELELSETLKAFGVTDVFDPSRADLSALFEQADGTALTEVQHAARLVMDEEGVTATAFTAMGYGAGGPALEMDFILNRPFLFKLSLDGTTPLFVGVVNQP